ETPTVSRGISPGADGARSGGPAKRGQPRQVTTEPQRVEIVLRVVPAEPQQNEPVKPVAEVATEPPPVPPAATEPGATGPVGEGKKQRMLNPRAKIQRRKTRNQKRFIRVPCRWVPSAWASSPRWTWSRRRRRRRICSRRWRSVRSTTRRARPERERKPMNCGTRIKCSLGCKR